MAKKLPVVQIAIAGGAGIATYFAATQLSQRVAFMQQHPIAAPAALAAVGVLIAKKHLPIGLGIAGAAGAIGYLQYKAGTTTQPVAGTTPVQQQTQPSNIPTSTPGTTADNTGTSTPGGVAQNVSDALQGQQGSTDQGAQPASGDGTGTGTAGYSAGKLLSGPHMHSHLATWRGGAGALMHRGTGKLINGPSPHSHLAPWHRNAGHYDAPAPGEAGGLRGGAYGLTSD